MKIAFVHTGESDDRIHVELADGTRAGWRWGASGPPHDLLHWVVETELPLARGFWGLVAAGADYGFHTDSHERPSAEAGDATQLLQAEGCVNAIQTGIALEPRIGDHECLEYARRFCEEAGVGLPADLDQRRYGEIRRIAEGWVGRYRELDPGEALHLTFGEQA